MKNINKNKNTRKGIKILSQILCLEQIYSLCSSKEIAKIVLNNKIQWIYIYIMV